MGCQNSILSFLIETLQLESLPPPPHFFGGTPELKAFAGKTLSLKLINECVCGWRGGKKRRQKKEEKFLLFPQRLLKSFPLGLRFPM